MSKFTDGLVDTVRAMTGPKLRSNQAINRIAKGAIHNGTGALEMASYMTQKENPMGLGRAFNKTFATNYKSLYNEVGERTAEKATLNYGKIAGSYIGTSAAARVVSGGGVTKDQHGNTNLIGVPFI